CVGTAPAGPYPLSLHDALPISPRSSLVSTSMAVPPPTASTAAAATRSRSLPSTLLLAVAAQVRPPAARMATVATAGMMTRFVGGSEEHTSELQSRENLVCRLLL